MSPATRLSQLIEDPESATMVREHTMADIEHRRGAIDQVEQEWAKYVTDVKQVNGIVAEVRGKIPTLEVIRENASVQISLLQLVALLRFLRQSSEAIRGTVDTLQAFRLAPLTPTRVRRCWVSSSFVVFLEVFHGFAR